MHSQVGSDPYRPKLRPPPFIPTIEEFSKYLITQPIPTTPKIWESESATDSDRELLEEYKSIKTNIRSGYKCLVSATLTITDNHNNIYQEVVKFLNCDAGENGRGCAEMNLVWYLKNLRLENKECKISEITLIAAIDEESTLNNNLKGKKKSEIDNDYLPHHPVSCGHCSSVLREVVNDGAETKISLLTYRIQRNNNPLYLNNGELEEVILKKVTTLGSKIPFGFIPGLLALRENKKLYGSSEILNVESLTELCQTDYIDPVLSLIADTKSLKTLPSEELLHDAILSTLNRVSETSLPAATFISDNNTAYTCSPFRLMLGTDPIIVSAVIAGAVHSVFQKYPPSIIVVSGPRKEMTAGNFLYSLGSNERQVIIDLLESKKALNDDGIVLLFVWKDDIDDDYPSLGFKAVSSREILPVLTGTCSRGRQSLYLTPTSNTVKFSAANYSCIGLWQLMKDYSLKGENLPNNLNYLKQNSLTKIRKCSCVTCNTIYQYQDKNGNQEQMNAPYIQEIQKGSQFREIKAEIVQNARQIAIHALPPSGENNIPPISATAIINTGLDEYRIMLGRSIAPIADDCVGVSTGLQGLLNLCIAQKIIPDAIIIALSKNTFIGPYTKEYLKTFLKLYEANSIQVSFVYADT